MIHFFVFLTNTDDQFVLGSIALQPCRRVKNIGCISNWQFKRRLKNELEVSNNYNTILESIVTQLNFQIFLLES